MRRRKLIVTFSAAAAWLQTTRAQQKILFRWEGPSAAERLEPFRRRLRNSAISRVKISSSNIASRKGALTKRIKSQTCRYSMPTASATWNWREAVARRSACRWC